MRVNFTSIVLTVLRTIHEDSYLNDRVISTLESRVISPFPAVVHIFCWLFRAAKQLIGWPIAGHSWEKIWSSVGHKMHGDAPVVLADFAGAHITAAVLQWLAKRNSMGTSPVTLLNGHDYLEPCPRY